MQSTSLETTQQQVNDVITVMQDNITKVMERDTQLTDLNIRSENMQAGASQFQVQSKQLKKKFCMKNFKWWVIMSLTIIAIILLIVGLSIGFGGSSSGQPAPQPAATQVTVNQQPVHVVAAAPATRFTPAAKVPTTQEFLQGSKITQPALVTSQTPVAPST